MKRQHLAAVQIDALQRIIRNERRRKIARWGACALLFLALGYLCRVAAADEQCVQAVSVVRGGVAPCTGILAPKAAILDAIACKSVELPRCLAEGRFVRETLTADKIAAQERYEAAEKAATRYALLYGEALKQIQPLSPWYTRAWFVAPVAMLVGVGGASIYFVLRR